MPGSQRTRKAIALSLAAALCLSGLALLAEVSHASLPSSGSPTDMSQIRRSVVWFGVPTIAPRTLHIESSSINAPSPDEFQISYADGNLTLSYQRVSGGPITSQYTLTFRGLVEWNDTHGDGDIRDGSFVAYTPLGPGAFGRYSIRHTGMTTAEGIGVNSFVIQSNRGDLSLNLTIGDGFFTLPSGQRLTPMEAKLSVDVRHNMSMPGTRLSLQMGITTDQRVVLENQSWDDANDFSTDDRALNVTTDTGSPSSSAYFAWSNSASVDGVTGSVIPSGPETNGTSGGYDFYLSYPIAVGGNLSYHVVHDPAMGVVSVAYLSTVHPPPGPVLPFVADAVLYGISLAGIAALVAVTALLVSRRRRREL